MSHPDSSPHCLDQGRFHESLAAARARFALLGKKHPDLKAYLVFSSPAGQTDITADPVSMLAGFPGLFLDNHAKTGIPLYIQELESTKKSKRDQESDRGKENHPKEKHESERTLMRLNKQIRQLTSALVFDGTCRVEIRFHELDYDLIWKLQTDELVDRRLTPQTKASIRIVLGTLSDFSKRTPPVPTLDLTKNS